MYNMYAVTLRQFFFFFLLIYIIVICNYVQKKKKCYERIQSKISNNTVKNVGGN